MNRPLPSPRPATLAASALAIGALASLLGCQDPKVPTAPGPAPAEAPAAAPEASPAPPPAAAPAPASASVAAPDAGVSAPVEVPAAPDILGLAGEATQVPVRGTLSLEVQLAADGEPAAHLWWSATCGAVARNPSAPTKAIFVAPPQAGSCVVTVQAENRARTARREASREIAVVGGGELADAEAQAAPPPAPRPAPAAVEPFFFPEPSSVAAAPQGQPEPSAPPAQPEPASPSAPQPAPSPAASPSPASAPPAPAPAASPAPAGPERWVTLMSDDFQRPNGAQVGGRWREYGLRRPGTSAKFTAGDGDWVMREKSLSIWAQAEIAPVEDFVTTAETFLVDGSRVEFELRATLPSAPEASVLAFWTESPESIRSLQQVAGKVGLGWVQAAGRTTLQVYGGGGAQPAPAVAAPAGGWTKHVLTIRNNRLTCQVGGAAPVEIPISPALDPGSRRYFLLGIRAHARQWHKVDVRNFRVEGLER